MLSAPRSPISGGSNGCSQRQSRNVPVAECRTALSYTFSTCEVSEPWRVANERCITLVDAASLADTVTAMRPMVLARDFAISMRFYFELVFQLRPLIARLVEMQLCVFSFILQAHYVREWADN